MAESITLKTSSAVTATGNGSSVDVGSSGLRNDYRDDATFELDVTVAATEVDDTLNVFIQTKIGVNWVDVIHFTEVLGNGGAKAFLAKIVGGLAQAEFENGAALGAAAIRNLIGNEFRTRWVIVDPGGSAASFTFSVLGKGG